MNLCVEELGMNQPLTISPTQVTYKQQPQQPGDINPTLTNPGLTYTNETNPTIYVTLVQPSSLTLIYVPIDTPNNPSNVNTFTVVFAYPNNTNSIEYPSTAAGTVGTTTTTTLSPSQTTTTTPPGTTTAAVQPPSSVSPQVNLPANFYVPQGTVIIFTITSTNPQGAYPTGVSIILVLSIFYLFETLY
jgi:hypothetical protein